VAVIVTPCVPTDADVVAAKVTVLAPDAGFVMVAGENVAATPLGKPVNERATGELNPNVTAVWSCRLPVFPRTTVTEFEPELSVNPPTLSVNTTAGDGETPALVPVTLIG
jgi:hypothetical protein